MYFFSLYLSLSPFLFSLPFPTAFQSFSFLLSFLHTHLFLFSFISHFGLLLPLTRLFSPPHFHLPLSFFHSYSSTDGSDYSYTTHTLTITPAQLPGTVFNINIPILDDKILDGKLRNFTANIQLQPTTLNVAITPSESQVTIEDDDSQSCVLHTAMFLV